MRRVSMLRLGAAGVLAIAMGCGTSGAPRLPDGFEDPGGGPSPKRGTASVVITGGEILKDGRSLLEIMRTRVPGILVTYGSTSSCPEVLLRGRSTVVTPSSPSIYVDGQHAMDTCILTHVDPSDVARVEVYPQGVTSRPGYLSDPYGLILIFIRRTND